MPGTQVNLETGELIQQDRPRRRSPLETRMRRLFERIGIAIEKRGDTELGEAIREEAKGMAGGLVNLTKHVKPLRLPLLTILSLVEPLLAFGRVVGILTGRLRSPSEQSKGDHS